MSWGKYILLLYAFSQVGLMALIGCMNVPNQEAALIITIPALVGVLMLSINEN